MANDGTHRGGGRVRAGAKPDALNEKLNQGRPAIRLTTTASDGTKPGTLHWGSHT